MWTYNYNNAQDELQHYGVLGMKWGVRRYQDKTGRLTKAGKDRYSDKKSTNDAEENKNKEKFHLTDKQKKAIKIGAVVVGASLAAYGAYRLGKSGKLDDFIKIGRSKVEDLCVSGIKQELFKSLDKIEAIDEAIKNANPLGGTTNCTNCSVAGFLRRFRGMDVIAKVDAPIKDSFSVVEECFINAKPIEGRATTFAKSKEAASDMLRRRYGDNASGIVGISWKNGSGHAFNWEIVNGKVSFYCCQAGLPDSIVSRYWSKDLINPDGHLRLARLDNLDINYDNLFKFVQ